MNGGGFRTGRFDCAAADTVSDKMWLLVASGASSMEEAARREETGLGFSSSSARAARTDSGLAAVEDEDKDAEEIDRDACDDDDFLFQIGSFHHGAASTVVGSGATLQSC